MIFPSWNFFDFVGDQIEVKFKLSEYMTWQKYSWDHEPSAIGILFNPNHNLSLAHYNIVEHFVSDIQTDFKALESYSSYKLLCSFLGEDFFQRWPDTSQFQFKIVVHKESEKIDLFTSAWIPVKKP